MSTHDEDRLTRSLHDRAHEVSGSPLALADVQRRARGIQRRRRAAGGLVAAVLVAVAVPVALNVSGTPGAERQVAPASTAPSESPSATPATATPTPTPAPTPTSTPTAAGPTAPTPTHQAVVADTTPLTVQGAPAGAPARVTYLKGGTVVVPGAAPADLPGGTAETIAPYRGGWLAVQRRQGTSYVVHIDASGRVTGSQPGGDRIVTSDDGVEVSWVEGGKAYLDTTNGHSDQAQSIDLPTGSDAYPVGFVGPGSVVVAITGQPQRYWVTDFATHQVVKGVLAVRATAQSTGSLGVETSYDGSTGTSCWAVRTNAGGDTSTTCDWTVNSFSPDGAHFVGYPSGADGTGSGTVALLDSATARPVVTFDRQGGTDTYVADTVWEDDTHVLASLHEDGAWYLVRLGLDGSLERLDRAPGTADTSPFGFAAHS